MTTHTPGPWAATTTPAGKGKVVDARGFSVCNTTAGSYGQQRADARLIAAAPDYYAATDVLLEVAERGIVNDFEGFGRALRMFREAHAKATGGNA